ncbi:MAG TPA: hypoxanthine phosphoribosyltransferase [Longimicrobiales bacterium]|nr:hypoxanthine phosphoribosyltransferase [Longimicrobiales bacterium]
MTSVDIDQARLGGRRVRRIVFTEAEVQERVRELGAEISQAYTPDDRLLVIGLLKGSFVFLADLVRAIALPLHVDFLVASSYGKGKVSSGDVRLLYDPESSLEGRSVLLVEDIVDSGITLRKLLPRLDARGSASLDVCTLLHKRSDEDGHDPRWVGFDAPNEFLVGYGLDHAEDFRHLPYIASL